MGASMHVPRDPAGLRRNLAGIAVLAIAYVFTALAGLLLSIPPENVNAVWPPSGLAVAALWIWGWRLWPGVALGTLVIAAAIDAPVLAGLGYAAGNTLEALLAVGLLARTGFDATRMGTRDVVRLVLLAGVVATAIAAAVGTTVLVATGGLAPEYFGVAVATWWIGNGLGVLLVAPFVLVWATCPAAQRRAQLPELLIVVAAALVTAIVAFHQLRSGLYLTFLPLLWAATRLGLRGAVSVSLVLWVVGAVRLMQAWVPLGTLPVASTLGGSQLYFLTCSVAGLLLGAAIGERDRARAALRSRDAWSRAVLDGVFDIVAVVDAGGVTRWATASVSHVLGRAPDEVVGHGLADLVHPDDLEPIVAQLRELAAEPHGRLPVRGRCRHADGTWRVLEANVTNALDDPSIRGFVFCSRDVTMQANTARLLEEAHTSALEAARIRSEFLANVSHELRTPLNVVFGVTDMLFDEPMPPGQREKVRTIRRSAAGLLHLIDDILDLAKIDAGRLELRQTTFDLAGVVDEALAALRPRAVAKGLVLGASIADGVPRHVLGDPDRIRQILLNYLSNAVKFTETGRVRLAVSVREETPDAVRVRFEVEDTGIGIPDDLRHRLFQPFSQIDGSMSRRYGGTGLGLAISKQLAELMGGSVGVTSVPGIGSVFWCELRLERAASAPEDVARAAGVLQPEDGAVRVEVA